MIFVVLLYVLPALITWAGMAKFVLEDDTKGIAIVFLALFPFVNIFFAIVVLGCMFCKLTESK